MTVALGLWAGGCGSSSLSSSPSQSSSSSSGGSTGTSQTASSTSSAAASTGLSSAEKQWAVTYAGATAGSATGAPVKIGYINQQGGPVAFLGATFGYNAVVKFLNQYASGIKGRPIQLDSCFVQSEEDGQRCAA